MDALHDDLPTILLVDDDRIHSRILRTRLEKQAYRVLEATSGLEGLEIARSVQPQVILCDWLMEGMDGLEMCRRIREEPQLASTYFILLTSRSQVEDRVQGLDSGADDFLIKPADADELLARVRSGLRLHRANQKLRGLMQDLQAQQALLDGELTEAARYVSGLLPKSLEGPVRIDSLFTPSSQLGGDSFDFFWLDDDHLLLYLIDVSGHGLAAALPSISVLNLLRTRGIEIDPQHPENLPSRLNRLFQMEGQRDRYLTLWCGIYQTSCRELRYASAGHPPALLFLPPAGSPSEPDAMRGGEGGEMVQLSTRGIAVGLFDDSEYKQATVKVPPGSTLLIYSDGIYEVNCPDGQMWNLPAFLETMESTEIAEEDGLARLVEQVKRNSGCHTFHDDYALVRARFA
jgi:sigma-B regulation protein RsbU (phosphoserine phosphatase)